MTGTVPLPCPDIEAIVELHKELIALNQDYARHRREGNAAALEANDREFDQWSKRLEAVFRHRRKLFELRPD